ncbi:hypothetical protein [Salinarimonas soli]|uniref:hypothetical protein n=1 Tax=Salinarimonas soli TaxID=1638099 RepID=UPI001AEEB5BF|nr:hypothetical protein [Salinarimonas soli]
MDGRSVALIGYGAIGRALAGLLGGEPRLAAVLVRDTGVPAARAGLPESVRVTSDVRELLAEEPDLVVECAGQRAVADHARPILTAGVPLMVTSTGALATPGLLDELTALGGRSWCRPGPSRGSTAWVP